MFNKDESLYINAIKYDTQLKLDYKKLSNGEIIEANNSVFLVNDEILAHDIAHKINASQEQTAHTYISTLLISDTTKLIPKGKGKKLKDCEVSHFNDDYDIAVLKTTLFETKHYFEKTGIDYIYSAFHILNLHIQQNICKNQLLIFLFNNKAFLLILDDMGTIVFSQTVDLPTFESVKKSHFYDDDVVGQKLYDEIYYLELNEIIHNTLNEFYEKKSKTFIDKVSILYTVKQLSVEQINQLNDELLLNIDYHPINIDEEIFELSRDIHQQQQSFIKPRKKSDGNKLFTNIFILVFFILAFFGIFKLYTVVTEPKPENKEIVQKKSIELPDHINKNDRVEQKIKAIFASIPYDVVLSELKLDGDVLALKGVFLKDDSFIKSLKPELEKLYKTIDIKFEDENKKSLVKAMVVARDFIELEDIEYKTNKEKYIVDEFFPISRVTEQIKILMPEDTIVKFRSSQNNELTKFNYTINVIVKTPSDFFKIIQSLNNEFYSINITYPLSILKVNNNLEIEFGLVFNQPK